MIHSYGKVHSLGHPSIRELLSGDNLIVEEKIDGSQINFMKKGDQLYMRSRNANIYLESPQEMFKKAVEVCLSIKDKLHEGWIYRGEYLSNSKHNILKYERIPKNHIMIFDIETNKETFLSPEDREKEAKRIGFEAVPVIYVGKIDDIEMLHNFLQRESVLGGTTIEGVVIKNYKLYDEGTGHYLKGKFVSEKFKEKHKKEWKQVNPTLGTIVDLMVEEYRTEARWSKAIQHLKENNTLTYTPKDIGNLIKEIVNDFEEECSEEIAQRLLKLAMKELKRRIVHGFPEWYKEWLAKHQFKQES